MAKFEIGAFAKSVGAAVSKLDTTEQLQRIDIDLLDENEANFYTLSNLQPLADSIAMDGLQQPLVVTPAEGGRYTVLSGHRRRAAIRMLLEENTEPWPELRSVPCLVRRYQSQNLAELQLILANSTARELTNAEKMKQAERMEMLLYQLKEEGYEFPGRMRDQVAAACKISAPKLARLKVIREHLIPEYMVLFEKDKLPEQTAYALARMPAEFQTRLFSVCPEPPTGYVVERLLKNYEDGWRWAPDLQCPDGKVCRRGDTFLRHDAEGRYSSHMCGGLTCCLNCDQAKSRYSPCERMCSKAKALRKEVRDEANAREEARKRELSDRYKAETQGYAKRLLRAIEAAGLSDDDTFPWDYYRTYSVTTVREYAAGQFAEGSVWSSPSLEPSRCHEPAKTAKALRCSTDYLLGLTDELFPAAGAAVSKEPAPVVAEEYPGEPREPAEDEPAPEAESLSLVPSAICGWRSADDPPEAGQRAIVQKEDEDYVLAIFQGGQWLELDMVEIGSFYAVEHVARWLPWLTPEEEPETVPSPPWRPAPPDRTRMVYGKFDAEGHEIVTSAYYDKMAGRYYFRRGGADISARCVGWVPLPEDV